jgi:nucleolar protein 58
LKFINYININYKFIGLSEKDLKTGSVSLSHNFYRHKLKFSIDKVDIMVIQAVGLLDDLDKELNNYEMRLREWYGWHFPEAGKIISDNVTYAKLVQAIGMKTNVKNTDLSEILTEEDQQKIKEAAEISMGSEISKEDELNIKELCGQIIFLSEYRSSLSEYLRNRMMTIAPNLTIMVGELVAARLISHAGSLVSLAKMPGSTIQIFGAEKALFRALKTKHETPKYGLIYHASLVGQANAKLKGKISRSLASKCALCVRVDALGENTNGEIGNKCKKILESRINALENGNSGKINKESKISKYDASENKKKGEYNEGDEMFLSKKKKREKDDEKEEKKKKDSESEDDEEIEIKKKNKKKNDEQSEKKSSKKKKKNESESESD